MSKKPPRLIGIATVDLPVVEASGITVHHRADESLLLVVGDRTARVAAAPIGAAADLGDWRSVDLAARDDWLEDGPSQFEAIAGDGRHLIGLLREDPPTLLVGDTSTGDLRARIRLTAPAGSPLHGHWDDPSSRGEGLVFLRGGRVLVAKEKRPRALIEFGPASTIGRGVSTEDFLDADEAWACPDGTVDYVALSTWRLRGSAKKALRDISALWVSPSRALWLLSDKSRAVGRVGLMTPLSPDGDDLCELAEVWRLPKGITKPEGITALDDEHLLVAMDTSSREGNGMIVRRPS